MENIEIKDCLCCWCDLLGYGTPFVESGWELRDNYPLMMVLPALLILHPIMMKVIWTHFYLLRELSTISIR